MTNDEAKKMLKAKLECLKHETSGTDYACNQHLCEGCSLNYEQGNMGEQKEALDMAVKALEQQPCKDCINRELLLKHLENITMDTNPDHYDSKDKWYQANGFNLCKVGIEMYVKNLPSVTPKQARWIPCSERLPEDNIHVLCQFNLGGMGECYLAHGAFHLVGGVIMTCNEVIAWMPLPEPYKIPAQTFGCAED